MNKSNKLFDWLDYKNEDELEWAVNYLHKKGMVDLGKFLDSSHKDVLFNIKISLSESGLVLLIKDMKAARNQRRNRNSKKKENQKNYSFVMDKSIQGKLKNLAGDQPIGQTLEQIINDIAQFKKQIEAELRKSIKPAKIRSNGLSNEEKSKRKIAQLEMIKTAQEQILKQLLLEVCQKEYAIEKTSKQLILLEEDRMYVSKKYKNRQQDINQKIKDQLRLFKFVAINMDTDIIGDEGKESQEDNKPSISQSE